MAVATFPYRSRSRDLPSTFKSLLKITHFIRIPLLNQTSSTQIQETLWRVANDPVAASVPPLAYQPSQQLRMSVAALSLPTQEKRDHAISLLQELGNHNWQKTFHMIENFRPSTRKPSSASPERLSHEGVRQIGPQPIVVSAIREVMFCQLCHVCISSHVSIANHFKCPPNCHCNLKYMP